MVLNSRQIFWLNDENYYIERKVHLADLISYFDYNTFLLVLEHNNSICQKKNWKTTLVLNSDKIEIITIVGGG